MVGWLLIRVTARLQKSEDGKKVWPVVQSLTSPQFASFSQWQCETGDIYADVQIRFGPICCVYMSVTSCCVFQFIFYPKITNLLSKH